MDRELKSRFAELYPPHKCLDCGMEHISIPRIQIIQDVEGQPQPVDLAPFELVGIGEGAALPGQETPFNTPATVHLLFWGPPGAQKAACQSILFMN